jgi:hypothetical protein
MKPGKMAESEEENALPIEHRASNIEMRIKRKVARKWLQCYRLTPFPLSIRKI